MHVCFLERDDENDLIAYLFVCMRLALRAFRRARLRSEFFAIRMVLGVVVVNIVVVSAVSLKLRLKYFAASIGTKDYLTLRLCQ